MKLTNRNEVLNAMTAHELPALAAESEIAIHRQTAIPLVFTRGVHHGT